MSAGTATSIDATRAFSELRREDVDYAGGKGANLGELTSAGLPVPGGFVVGAPAYAASASRAACASVCRRSSPRSTSRTRPRWRPPRLWPGRLSSTPRCRRRSGTRSSPPMMSLALGDGSEPAVAVRSSATAEDTASASFAGMNETFLNIRGADAVIDAVRRCWVSLFGPRTIYYRGQRGFSQAGMDIAVVVQIQIPSTRAGVMFTANPASGENEELVIEGSFGLGEAVVSGSVSPDRYVVQKSDLAITTRSVRPKELVIEPAADGGTVTRALSPEESMRPVLSDAEVIELAELGMAIEAHYESPQDTEWSFDPEGNVWMLQSRPITTLAAPARPRAAIGRTAIGRAAISLEGEILLHGLGAAPGRASGVVRLLSDPHDDGGFRDGEVLVAHMTTPDWVPLMRRAAAIVTDSGGMTCHAAIVSRELGIPCVAGTGEATTKLRDGETVTVDAKQGVVIEGADAPAPADRARLGRPGELGARRAAR